MNIKINKVKITITVPLKYLKVTRNELFKNGIGIIGNYTNCSINYKCISTFKPNKKSNPYIGKKYKTNYVKEQKLEIICETVKVKNVIKIIRKIHPYEEPVICITPLLNEKDFF